MRCNPILWLVLALFAAACAGDETLLGPSVACDTTNRGRLLLFAQAVPAAQSIPCLGGLAPGWEIREIETRTGEAVLHLSEDGSDVEATATLVGSCPGVTVDADAGGVMLLRDMPMQGEHVYVFTGGCVRVSFGDGIDGGAVEELLGSIGFVSRDDLRALSGWEL